MHARKQKYIEGTHIVWRSMQREYSSIQREQEVVYAYIRYPKILSILFKIVNSDLYIIIKICKYDVDIHTHIKLTYI